MKQVSNFTSRFSEMLYKLNVTQQQVSDRTGLNKSIISRYVYGAALPKSESLNRIAKAFNINPMWLMGYDVDIYNIINNNKDIYKEKLYEVNETLNEEQRKKLYNMAIVMFPDLIK